MPDVAAHGVGKNPLAQQMMRRLRVDLDAFAKRGAQGALELAKLSEADAQSYVSMPSGPGVTAAIGKVEEVATALRALVAADGVLMLEGMKEAERLAAAAPTGFTLAQYAGTEARLPFELLVALLVCGHGTSTLIWLNPSLDKGAIERLNHLVGCTMLVAARRECRHAARRGRTPAAQRVRRGLSSRRARSPPRSPAAPPCLSPPPAPLEPPRAPPEPTAGD